MGGVIHFDRRRKYRRSRPAEVISLTFKLLDSRQSFTGSLIDISKAGIAFTTEKFQLFTRFNVGDKLNITIDFGFCLRKGLSADFHNSYIIEIKHTQKEKNICGCEFLICK